MVGSHVKPHGQGQQRARTWWKGIVRASHARARGSQITPGDPHFGVGLPTGPECARPRCLAGCVPDWRAACGVYAHAMLPFCTILELWNALLWRTLREQQDRHWQLLLIVCACHLRQCSLRAWRCAAKRGGGTKSAAAKKAAETRKRNSEAKSGPKAKTARYK